jgi:CBS domain-containing protein
MTDKVLTVSPQNTVAEGKQKMLKADVGAIIIMDKKMPIGIFTEYDIVMQFYDQHGKLQMSDIGKYMRKYVRAVPPETSIFAANRLMLEKNMRRLLIVKGTEVAGIVTQTDICRYLYGQFEEMLAAAQDAKIELKRFSLDSEIHGEFRGEHLKVYEIE